MRYLLALALCSLMVGCHHPIDVDRMATNFSANREALERLRTMIHEDRGERECFRVGDLSSRFGQSDLSVALEEAGITRERYDEYLSLLASVGGVEVRACADADDGWTRIIMEDPGPCSTTYEINDDGTIPDSRVLGDRDWVEITPLSEGWYIERDCEPIPLPDETGPDTLPYHGTGVRPGG